MTIIPLKSYMRTYRKRTGLTHEEVAFLCGAMYGTSVARHERASRLPMLKTALMYELILGASVRQLYDGVYHVAREAVRARASGLLASLQRKPQTPKREQKLAALRRLLDELAEEHPTTSGA